MRMQVDCRLTQGLGYRWNAPHRQLCAYPCLPQLVVDWDGSASSSLCRSSSPGSGPPRLWMVGDRVRFVQLCRPARMAYIACCTTPTLVLPIDTCLGIHSQTLDRDGPPPSMPGWLTRCLILFFQPGLHTGVTGTLLTRWLGPHAPGVGWVRRLRGARHPPSLVTGSHRWWWRWRASAEPSPRCSSPSPLV